MQNNILANFPKFRPFSQKNFSAYLSGKHQNLFCPTASKFCNFVLKAHSATVPFKMERYSNREIKIFKNLKTPKKIQDFLDRFKINFEDKGETCYSPRMVFKKHKCHCMEGALFAAAALEFHGHKPLVMDLRAASHDFDHVVAVFKQFGCFGAISKTNHAILRFREPVYKTIRELALSYFHEYFDDIGRKNLREYSRPFNLRYFDQPGKLPPHPSRSKSGHPLPQGRGNIDNLNWRTASENLFQIPDYLDRIKHYKILSPRQIRNLRKADPIEIKAGKLLEWKK